MITEVRWIVCWSGCDKFLKHLKVPQTGIETKRSKLVMKPSLISDVQVCKSNKIRSLKEKEKERE